MSKHISRSGGKFGGSHTTFTPVAALAAEAARKCPTVTNIAPGIINQGRGKSGSRRNVKIVDVEGGILLVVTDGAAHQEVRVYTANMHRTKLHIAKEMRDRRLSISFGNRIPRPPDQ